MKPWILLSLLLIVVTQPQTSPSGPLESKVIDWNSLTPVQTRTGQRRDVFDAPTGTLDKLHGHITTLNPGENTGPLHRHPQEELIVIKEGTLEVNIDGRKQTASAGSLVFFGVNENENMTNVGRTPATYLVLQWFTPRTPTSNAATSAATVDTSQAHGRWSEADANAWYAKQPWLVGSNYIPATAINELEMWQADTFDPQTIDKELGWAEGLGMTTMRVFLHDLPWQQDAAGYRSRIDRFLAIADRHHIKPLFVLFDSCWDPQPRLGTQHPPTPGVHNSGWVQSPGAAALQNPADYPRLEAYVRGVVGAFGKDPRVLGWDVWNEPDNVNTGSYAAKEPKDKVELVLKLLPQVFQWARAAGAQQPLTSGVWKGDWSSDDKLSPMEHVQLESSDVISFHNYDSGPEFAKRIQWLVRYHRPIICTEYMARGNGSTFQGSLPIAQQHHVGAINWGFVAGKTQTNLPWDSWKQPYTNGREPAVWFHEIFRPDGTPYKADEVALIRSLTGAARK